MSYHYLEGRLSGVLHDDHLRVPVHGVVDKEHLHEDRASQSQDHLVGRYLVIIRFQEFEGDVRGGCREFSNSLLDQWIRVGSITNFVNSCTNLKT